MKKRKRTKQRGRTPNAAPAHYSIDRYGPLILERHGRFLSLRSEWDPKEFEEYIARVKANREPFRKEIKAEIAELLALTERYNPLELLSVIALQNDFANPENYKETTHEGKESHVEYALSIALSIREPNVNSHAPKEAIDRFVELIGKVFNDVGWFFAMEQLEEEDKTKHDLRYLSIMRYLLLRGDSYQEHHLDLVKGLFTPHDSFLHDHYGFTSGDVLRWISNVEGQVVDAFFRQAAFMLKLHEMHEIFKRFVDERDGRSISSMDECMSAYDALPEVRVKKQEIEELHRQLDDFVFEVKPSDDLPETFLHLLSARFGDNADFALFEKSPAWPTNDSVIHTRPLVFHQGRYYCFLPQMLFRNLITLFEGLIREKDTLYFETAYQKARGEYLVTTALNHFAVLLPSARVYPSLYYEGVIDGKKAQCETDGLIIFDTNLFIVEGKAGSLSVPARRGALSRLKRDVSDLVDSAYEQASRTRRFINETEVPRFEYENGTEALILDRKDDLQNVFLVNVTLENLGHLSTQLTTLKTLNLIRGKEWPWSVMVNDLRVISEIMEGPSEFLVYLSRRIRANDHPQFRSSDELDFLMYYLRDGLYFEDDHLKHIDHFSPHGYTEDLDRWFDFLGGRVSSGQKPRLEIPEEYKTLIRRIERSAKPGFSEVTTTLLGFDVETMQQILDRISEAKLLSFQDGKDHDLTLVFGNSDLGLTIAVSSNKGHGLVERMSEYCSLKMYQLKLTRWIFLILDADDRSDMDDFRIFKRAWSPDEQMERELVAYRARKLEQYFASGRKPGRNDPCPCNGGLKYKKCCGSVSQAPRT